MSITAKLERALDRRGWDARSWLRRATPGHWSGLFGVVTAACLAVLVVTGIVLMFFYVPSSEQVVYGGAYAPLHGAEVSKAFDSTLAISLSGGLLIRQAHHWAALLLPASIIAQLLATFFTGAFRRPRQWVWVLLFLTLIAALAAGWSGYALPDDMLSGTGLRIVEGIVLGIPLVGTWIAALLFGGDFPGRIIENLYPLHLAFSVVLVALVVWRARVAWAHPVLRMRGSRVRGSHLSPRVVPRLFAAVCGILILISATVTISPIWLYGPSDPGNASAGSQPDWYTGFLDGALRLVPPGWEIEVGGYTLTLAVLVPLAVVGAFLAAVLVYPFVENWVTRASGDVLDRPRDVPTRTAIGVAGMTFYGVLWGAASADVVAVTFHLSLETVLIGFQVGLVLGPIVAFSVTRRACLGLQRRDRAVLRHGYETGRIVRLPGGEYVEQHLPVPPAQRELLGAAGYAPIQLRPDSRGRLRWRAILRAWMSRLLFRDRIAPVTGSVGTAEDRHIAA